jgi:hypothetical protein
MGWADDMYAHGLTTSHGGLLKEHYYTHDTYQVVMPNKSDIFGPNSKLYYLSRVQEDGLFLAEVPKANLEYDICVKAVKQNAWALRHVPLAWRGESICLLAVRHDPSAFQYIPIATQTAQIIAVATSYKHHSDTNTYISTDAAIRGEIPEVLACNSPAMLAYPQGSTIEYPSPKQFFNLFKIWHAEPDVDMQELEYVFYEAPEHIKESSEYKQLTKLFASNDSLQRVDNTYVYYHDNYEQTKLGQALSDYIEDQFEYQKRHPGSIFGDISPGEIGMTRNWVEHQVYIRRDVHLSRVPKANITESMCARILSKDGSQIRYVPEQFLSETMCWLAVTSPNGTLYESQFGLRNNETVLDFIPDKYVSYDLCLAALKCDPKAIFAFKDEYISEDIAIEAISRLGKHNEDFFKTVNKRFYTKPVCDEALRHNIEVLRYVPVGLASGLNVLQYVAAGHELALLDKSLIHPAVFECIMLSDAEYDVFKENIKCIPLSLMIDDKLYIRLASALIRADKVYHYSWLPDIFKTLALSLPLVRHDKENGRDVPHDIAIKHPFLLAFAKRYHYPTAYEFGWFLEGWFDDDTIDHADIKVCIENAPHKIRESEEWKKWADANVSLLT